MHTPSYEELERKVAQLEQLLGHGAGTASAGDPLQAQRMPQPVQELLLVADAAGMLLFANQPALDFFADVATSVVGRSVVDIFPLAQAETVLTGLRRVVVDGASLHQQLVLNSGSGSRWFEMSLTPIPFGAPPQTAALILLLDVTAQLAQQDSLRQSEAQYHALFASMQEGVIYFNAPHEILRANSAAERILGCSTTAEIQQRLLRGELWTPVDSEGCQTVRETDPITRCFVAGLP
jgi:PAS domain-containing protein